MANKYKHDPDKAPTARQLNAHYVSITHEITLDELDGRVWEVVDYLQNLPSELGMLEVKEHLPYMWYEPNWGYGEGKFQVHGYRLKTDKEKQQEAAKRKKEQKQRRIAYLQDRDKELSEIKRKLEEINSPIPNELREEIKLVEEELTTLCV